MVNIFFDFDGTLVNSQGRLYELFIELCPECKMNYDEYWTIKRTRITQADFLKKYFAYTDEQTAAFHKSWLQKVEEPERIDCDVKVVGADNELQKLAEEHTLYLVTNRQSKMKVLEQVHKFGWQDLFADILVTQQKQSKKELIEKAVNVTNQDALVSDTGEDIKTAKALGIKSVAVAWGVLNKQVLSEYKPDMILENVSEISGII
jgi:phosphoglycolate phosphatase-like HAD superfamily hydrolase